MLAKIFIPIVVVAMAIVAMGQDASDFTTITPSRVACDTEGDSAKILEDHSVQFGLEKISFCPEVHYRFRKELTISEIRLEILPDTRFEDSRLHRGPGDDLILFALDASIQKPGLPSKIIEFDSARNPDDDDDDTAPHVIDFLSDTGWKVGALKIGTSATSVICTFDKPVKIPAGDSLIFTLDTGGSPDLATPARIRIAFR